MLTRLRAVGWSSFCLGISLFVQYVDGCGPNQPGCYYGQSSSGYGGLQVQQCNGGLNNNWCAISYSPAQNQAQYMCANQLPIAIGGQPMNCGEGALGINNQGCQTVNTANGPCYLCCCVGPTCNNPVVFGREASRYFSGNNHGGGGGSSGQFLPFYNPNVTATISTTFLIATVILSLLISI